VHVIPRRNSFSTIDANNSARSFCEANLEVGLGLSDIEEGSRTDGAHSENSNSGLDESRNTVLQEPEESPLHLSIKYNGATKNKEGYVDRFFDTPFAEVEAEIRRRSIYRNFKTWKLVNIMVKTGDNLKQGRSEVIQSNSPCS